jgi:hypothetical protein
VILKTDADQAGMTEAVRAFGAALERKGGVGLFYFAGQEPLGRPGPPAWPGLNFPSLSGRPNGCRSGLQAGSFV